MSDPENMKMALEMVNANYREITEINKRTGDRTTIILGATVTAFGLIAKLSDGPTAGGSLLFLCLALIGLAACFFSAVVALFPKAGEQPGSTDVDFLWKEYVLVDRASAYANTMNDLCRVLRLRRETGIKTSYWFRCVILSGAFTLVCISISEALSVSAGNG